MVLHDYGLAFNSPFVNLFIEPSDYIKLLGNLKSYCSENSDIKEIPNEVGYPIGILNDSVKLHFLHYKNFDDAVSIWRKRCLRMDFSNPYIIFVQQKGCSDEIIDLFSKIDFPKKVMLVNKDKTIPNQFIIPGFENEDTLGIITDYSGWNGHRFYDAFNWKEFLELT